MSKIVPIKKTDSIFDEMKQVQDRIMRRAYDLFEAHGRSLGRDLDHWLTAEHQLVWKPAIELIEKEGEFSITIAVPGVDPQDIDIEVTPDFLLVKAETRHGHQENRQKVHICEFDSGNLFRSIRLPKKIDTNKVKAEFKNGILNLTAGIAAETVSKRIELKVS